MLLAISLCAISLVLISMELAARLWLRTRQNYYVLRPFLRAKVEIDSDNFHCLKSPIKWYVNGDGERCRDVPASSGKLFRVLAAGGSFVECGLLDQDKTWPAVLEQILDEHKDALCANGVHVGNIGRSEADSGAVLQILERVLPRYEKLDLIVLACGVSNVLRWLGAGCPDGRPPEPLSPDVCFAQFPGAALGWKPRQTALAELIRRWSFQFGKRVENTTARGEKKRAASQQRSQMTQFYTLTEDPSGMADGFERDLRAILTLARARSRRVIVVHQPWFEKAHFTPEEEAQLWSGWVGKTPRGEKWQFVSHRDLFELCSLISQRTSLVTREMEIEEIVVKSVLEPSLRIYYDHFHLTDEGAACTAKHVAAFVLAGQAAGSVHAGGNPRHA